MHALLALLGIRSAQRTLVDVVVDPLRNVLYTLDLEGNMDLFDLGADGNHTTQKVQNNNISCRFGKADSSLRDIFMLFSRGLSPMERWGKNEDINLCRCDAEEASSDVGTHCLSPRSNYPRYIGIFGKTQSFPVSFEVLPGLSVSPPRLVEKELYSLVVSSSFVRERELHMQVLSVSLCFIW